jgi:hypothetical protein
VRARIEEDWTNLEAEKEATVHLEIAAVKPFVGRVVWGLAIGNATIARGDSAIEVAVGGRKSLPIKIAAQSTRSGTFLEMKLAVATYMNGGRQSVASIERKYWVLPADPFADRRQWAKKLRAVLYDPKGSTAEILRKADFPFVEQRNLAALGELTEGTAILAEGLSWREEPGIEEVVWKLAERGVRVLCLAPTEGTFSVSGLSKKGRNDITRMTFASTDIIASWDGRLDAGTWSGGVPSVASRVSVQGEGTDAMAVFGPDRGWPWAEVRVGRRGAKQGVVAVCGFGVMRRWDEGPTPRHVFLRALESITENK